jgi:hypothetical protein
LGQATRPRGTALEDRVTIEAPAEAIWALIRDVDDWSRWNPLYASASGPLIVGRTLDIAIALPGMKPQPARPTVTAAVPNERMHYLTVAMGGLVKAHRYVEIEPAGQGRSSVLNGEIMGGLVGPLLAAAVGARVRDGMRQMNAALKEQAEASVRVG